jgi:phage tail sheath protein FI
MPVYQSPGVYVEEAPSAVKPIAGVSTSTAAFIGIVPDVLKLVARGQPDADGRPTTKLINFTLPLADKTPALITNWTQFTKQFGDLVGDSAAEGIPVENPAVDEGHRKLAHAVYGFFNNGGSRCYVARIKPTSDPLGFDPADLGAALKALEAIDEIALVAAPGMIDDSVRAKLVGHCNTTGDRFAIIDGPATGDPANPPAGVQPSDMAASYFPWIKVFDPASALKDPSGDGQLPVPPSGHVAGVYARVDAQRGVFKSPANESILGALGVSQPISKADQDNLNPAGVNCIRLINGAIMVWGARTLGGDANGEMKYISTRRTLLFLRESIEEGVQWAVFEPNTPALWQRITRNVTAFLTDVWRSGALFGASAREAFFVKCDAETNPPELRNVGQVVAEVGVAIARPAEFVIFRISQSTAPGR